MPLKLIAPAKAPGGRNFYIRGTYLGVGVYQSAGTDRKPLAVAELRRLEREIEHGRFAEPAPQAGVEPTFADAVLGYLQVCPKAEVPRVERLLAHFTTTPLSAFRKKTIDDGEEALYPGRRSAHSAGVLNREYRSPLGAVLHSAAEAELMPWIRIKRYKEAQKTRWLEPDRALALIAAAAAVDAAKQRGHDARLHALLVVLFTTGLRISEACRIDWPLVNLKRREIGPLLTKNGEEYVVHLGDLAVEAIANLPGKRVAGRKIFGFKDRHAVKWSLAQACLKTGMVKRDAKTGAVLKDRNSRPKTTFNLHQARHSFMTWLRRQEGMDMNKLQALGRIKDAKTVGRYAHVAAEEHAPAIAALPINKMKERA
jgi:integrase